MHVEIKYAQNFVLNFLYNKLPRRRVNLFGEELESALRDKFKDHWYPDKPFKGSAFRCLKITDPADPVLNRAARESGNPILDIIENLPSDLAIWIDPGEVSYRIGEKGSVKILYSEKDGNPFFQGGGSSAGGSNPSSSSAAAVSSGNSSGGSNASSSSSGGLFNNLLNGSSEDLNPEIVGLLSSENLLSGLSSLSLSRSQSMKNASSPPSPFGSSAPSNSSSNAANPPNQQPLTYTAGMFAQTKFGSTKLKTSGKKTSRMSPTEFSNYIKTRAALQKQQQQTHIHHPPFKPRMCRSFREDAGGYFAGGTSSSYGGGGSNNSPASSCSSGGSSYNDPFKSSFGPPQHIKGGPSPPSSPSSSSWTYASDPETEAFLQDIFSVGLRSQVDMAFEQHTPGGFLGGPPFGGARGGGDCLPLLGRNGSSNSGSNNPNNVNNPFPSSTSSFKTNANPGQGTSDKYQQRILVAN